MSERSRELKDRLYELHAQLCRAMASEKRLEILDTLKCGERRVDVLAEIIGSTKANTSQHLGVLKAAGIVCSRKEGRSVYYSICDSRIAEACGLIRAVMLDRLRRRESSLREIVDFAECNLPEE